MRGLFHLFLGLVAFVAFCVCTPQLDAAGFGGRGRVQVNVGNGGLGSRGFNNNAFRGNGFNRGAQINVFNGGGFNNGARFNSFNNGFRVNAFGSRTVVDRFGNVFEVNGFGQPLIRSSSFRGFGVNSFGAFAAPGCF